MFEFYLFQEHIAVYIKASNLQQALFNYENQLSIYVQSLLCVAVPLGGNVHRILLQNEPMFTLNWGKTHNEGKEIWSFSYSILFSVLDVCRFRITICIFSELYA